jgi:hypothetical protein
VTKDACIQVKKIATLINALVDMEYFTEEEEQIVRIAFP